MKRILAAAAALALMITPAHAALNEGDKAPDFQAQGMQGGKGFTFSLSESLKKGPVVVYFFPAAFTPGCTEETKRFADAADEFKAAGATLIGVTGQARMADGSFMKAEESLKRLAEFSAEHCRDKFQIAAVKPETIASFQVTMGGKAEWSDRTSYVIGSDGKIVLAFTDPKAGDHIVKTLEKVKAMSKGGAAQ